MNNVEMIEKLMEKADVTYEEAKGVLESLNWNLLDALIALEKEGKMKKPEQTGYSTKQEIPEDFTSAASEKKGNSFIEMVKSALRWTGKVICKGMDNKLCIIGKNGKMIMEIPLTILAVLMIPAFWLIIICLVIALFNGCQFKMTGPDLGTDKVNNVMDKIRITSGDGCSVDIDDSKK
ncbi:MAG: DUF4342 domain-containing protein [Oscillospiraceae bacterium]|nr:DUF4342 domain-containing protein [Oscillospiraceae bacterium]